MLEIKTLKLISKRLCIIGIKPSIIYILSYLKINDFGVNCALGFTIGNAFASTLGFYLYKESFKSYVSGIKLQRHTVHKLYVNFLAFILIISVSLLNSFVYKTILLLLLFEFLTHESGRFLLYIKNKEKYISFYLFEYFKYIPLCILLYNKYFYYASFYIILNTILFHKHLFKIKFRYMFFTSWRKVKLVILILCNNIPIFIGGLISKLRVNIDRFILLLIPNYGLESYIVSVFGACCAVWIDTTILLKWREQLKNNNFKSKYSIDKTMIYKTIGIFFILTVIYVLLAMLNLIIWEPIIFFPIIIGHCLNTFTLIYEERIFWQQTKSAYIYLQTIVLTITLITVIFTITLENPFFVAFNCGFCFIIIYFLRDHKILKCTFG